MDAIIFDLDGTLWDSTDSCVRGWNRALQSLGVKRTLSRQDLESIMGLNHDEALDRMFPEADADLRQSIDRVSFDAELEAIRFDGGGLLYPGVREGLQRLSRHFPLFIVSNCRAAYLKVFFDCTGLQSLFRDVECYGNTGLSKGENLKRLIERNRLSSPVFVGDTAGDHRAALFAELPYFHVDYGFGEPLNECYHFREFGELVDFFLAVTETP